MTTERDDLELDAVEPSSNGHGPVASVEPPADPVAEVIAEESRFLDRVAQVVAEEVAVEPAAEESEAGEQLAAATTVEVLPKEKRRILGFRSRWALFFALLATLAVLAISGISVAAIQYARSYDGKIMPGATIAGVEVGGLNRAEALAKVRAAIKPELNRDVLIRWQAQRWNATPAELGAKSDARRAVEEALYESSNASFVDKVEMRLGGELGFERDVAIRYPKQGVRGFVQGLASSFDQEAQDAHIDYSNNWVKIVKEKVGRTIEVDASTNKVLGALRNGVENTKLVVETKKPEVTADEFDQVLLLHIGDNRLYLYQDGKITHEYTVATGQAAYPTPQGEWEVINKRYMPTWVNPAPDGWGSDMPATIGPGVGNPLGVRAIDWNASGIRFHGTQDLGSLGHNASHGCVRMSTEDVIELYDLVEIGTPIVSIQTGPYQ
ncbi:MAG TPA: L,D-transpeptidase family protein [Actinomycetota bacterium]|jgi:lipoprotein-anchoring transpeptidase ErfK/SrfK/predicted nucleic acid-binding Zn ribbon protein